LLARSAGERGVNDLLTGQIQSSREKLADCQDLGAQMELLAALQCFDEVLLEEPENVEALTYRGWFVVLAGASAEAGDQQAADLLVAGQTYLDRAVELDPTYIDARVFRASIYDRAGNADAACAEVADLLALDPPQFFVDQTRGIVDRNGC
jgi:tetratricopeptide (TPR) repeat protein